MYQANGRQYGSRQKTRGEVRASTRKLWRQKGTGNARTGAGTSNIQTGGGVAFASRAQKQVCKINKKMYKKAIIALLIRLQASGKLVIVKDMNLKTNKTKDLVQLIEKNGWKGSLLFLLDEVSDNFRQASSNLYDCDYVSTLHVSPVSLYYADKVIITEASLKQLEDWLL